ELVVSVIAALRGAPDIAVGNVVGSNIVNVGFIMGLAAVIAPICLASMPVWRDLALAIVATVAVGAFALDGRLARPEAVLMLG
ncbi:MAG: calcium/sodium antiporter, partial [Gemmatimonadetes bacterium]|nr:calcium/sodium antiporter [Gemmatimonadota bacterium]NIT67139.1 calcium/sodium antiporter [Gemmatimonadota bacterium]NIU53597.1 calcium/sodium antiporter [Gemmatimonadota bacterium]NIV23921.1 calcium/sodium antiporter [Gemmatimonadota bacterium]NIW37515.1 calcium/sodium antiporter [Gemmatimonadota bacterium]